MPYKFNPFTGNLDEIGSSSPDVEIDDQTVIDLANSANPTLTYNGSNQLTNVAYSDITDITNNSKVISYNSTKLDSVTHTFDYKSQTWTVVNTLIYTGDQVTGRTRTVNKV